MVTILPFSPFSRKKEALKKPPRRGLLETLEEFI
jgi:hypothetical protein